MTDQPPDYAALRAVCEEAIRANEIEAESLVVHIPEKRHTITMKPQLVLVLLDRIDALEVAAFQALEHLTSDHGFKASHPTDILRTALGDKWEKR